MPSHHHRQGRHNGRGLQRWARAACFVSGALLALAALAQERDETLAPPDNGPADLLSISNDAVQFNPGYQAASAAFRAAQELVPQARGRLLPQLSAFGEYDWQRQNVDGSIDSSIYGDASILPPLSDRIAVHSDDTYTRNFYGVQLRQTLFRQQQFLGLSAADLRVQQAGLALTAAQEALLVDVAESYFGLLGARDAMVFAQAKAQALKEQLDHARARADAGLSTLADVKTAQASYEIAVADQGDAVNALSAAQTRLEALTGKPYPAIKVLPPDVTLTAPTPLDEQAWVSRATTENPALQSQRAAAEAAKVEVRSARSARYPQVDLVGIAYRFNNGGGLTGDRNEDDERIGVRATMPLYSGGTVSATIRQAEALEQKAQADLQSLTSRTVRDTRIAYLNASTGLQRVKALKRAVEASIDAEDAARAGYEAGTRNNTDVLDAVEKRYGAERDYAGSRYLFLVNSLRLKQLSGNLLTDDIAQISRLLQLPALATGAAQ